jgi:hypothetical protein
MERIDEEPLDIEKYLTTTCQLLSAHSDFLFYFIQPNRDYPVRHIFETLSFHLLTLEEFKKYLNQQCRTLQ